MIQIIKVSKDSILKDKIGEWVGDNLGNYIQPLEVIGENDNEIELRIQTWDTKQITPLHSLSYGADALAMALLKKQYAYNNKKPLI